MAVTRRTKARADSLESKIPNAETRAAMREARELMKAGSPRFKNAAALFRALDKSVGKPLKRSPVTH